MSLKNRFERLRQQMAENRLDAFLVSQAENRGYLSGFDGWEGFLLITLQDEILITDFRFIEQAQHQAPGVEVFRITNNIADWFPHLIAGLNLKRLGVEAGHITLAFHRQLYDALNKAKSQLQLIPLDRLVESLRAVKEPEEIELITQAAAISDHAFAHIEDTIRAGMSEQEVAWEIERFMREHGSQPLPFKVIVASGPNSALPHAQPTEHAIREGEPILIDIGARTGSYGSDLSRAICLGSQDNTFTQVYDTVLSAQMTAIAVINEGVTGGEADSMARNVIKEAGYGKAFGHSLGHGVGLAAHEMPRLGPNSPERLTNGMVFTVEPGIYLSGWGGVRIEDTVVMENGKIRAISQARKERG